MGRESHPAAPGLVLVLLGAAQPDGQTTTGTSQRVRSCVAVDPMSAARRGRLPREPTTTSSAGR